jgi:hypothetical protein
MDGVDNSELIAYLTIFYLNVGENERNTVKNIIET